MTNAVNVVLFAFYSNDNYFDTLKEVYSVLPYYYALDYLHLFYIKQIVFKCFLSLHTEASVSLVKTLVINLPLDVFFSFITTK